MTLTNRVKQSQLLSTLQTSTLKDLKTSLLVVQIRTVKSRLYDLKVSSLVLM